MQSLLFEDGIPVNAGLAKEATRLLPSGAKFLMAVFWTYLWEPTSVYNKATEQFTQFETGFKIALSSAEQKTI